MTDELKLVLLFDRAENPPPPQQNKKQNNFYIVFYFCTALHQAVHLPPTPAKKQTNKQKKVWCQSSQTAAAGSSQNGTGLQLAGHKMMGSFQIALFFLSSPP